MFKQCSNNVKIQTLFIQCSNSFIKIQILFIVCSQVVQVQGSQKCQIQIIFKRCSSYHFKFILCSNSVQNENFFKPCSMYSGQSMNIFKLCSNSVQTMFKQCSNSNFVHTMFKLIHQNSNFIHSMFTSCSSPRIVTVYLFSLMSDRVN